MIQSWANMAMCFGTATVTYVYLTPGDQTLQAVVGGGLIGFGALWVSDK